MGADTRGDRWRAEPAGPRVRRPQRLDGICRRSHGRGGEFYHRRRQRMLRYSTAVGVAPVETLADLLDLLSACRVVAVDDQGRYALNNTAPLPAEVLPLER